MTIQNVLKFTRHVGRLKTTARSGWVSHVNMEKAESIADHSFRCAVLAMCLGDLAEMNADKLIRMLLLHDVQEALTGDYDLFAKERTGSSKVKQLEKKAIKQLLSLLPSDLKERYFLLWQEFEAQTTPEAILAKDIDRIEMVMQALEYEEAGFNRDALEPFWCTAENQIETLIGKTLFDHLRKKRKQLTE
ncbi:MAG: HD domain-containing protein [Candidatus Bathyarchaeota archaeon]|nr:MAG: HD domain-containing protein [Candidatus Bathyarchaeota archaeon]